MANTTLKSSVMASSEDFGLSNLASARSSGYEENAQSNVYSRRSQIDEREHEHPSLSRADGGKDAWLFLAGCFSIEALTWGKSSFFGWRVMPFTPHLPSLDGS